MEKEETRKALHKQEGLVEKGLSVNTEGRGWGRGRAGPPTGGRVRGRHGSRHSDRDPRQLWDRSPESAAPALGPGFWPLPVRAAPPEARSPRLSGDPKEGGPLPPSSPSVYS